MMWELCTVLGLARQHEALADVLGRTTAASSDGSAIMRCQAEVRMRQSASWPSRTADAPGMRSWSSQQAKHVRARDVCPYSKQSAGSQCRHGRHRWAPIKIDPH